MSVCDSPVRMMGLYQVCLLCVHVDGMWTVSERVYCMLCVYIRGPRMASM